MQFHANTEDTVRGGKEPCRNQSTDSATDPISRQQQMMETNDAVTSAIAMVKEEMVENQEDIVVPVESKVVGICVIKTEPNDY